MPSGIITHAISTPYWEDRKGVTKGGNDGTFFSFWFLKQHHLRFLQPKWQEFKEWDIIAVPSGTPGGEATAHTRRRQV